jgi:flagellar biosynthetic protein FliP
LVEVLQGEEVLLLGVTSQGIQLIDRRNATAEEMKPAQSAGLASIVRGGLRLATVLLFIVGGLALTTPLEALAQNIPLFESVPSKGGGTNYSVPVQTVILLTALSFLPAMLMLMTSFTRILIVLSLLRQAMGLVTTPPNAVLVGLALFITAAVMAPVSEKVYADAWQPYVAGRINFEQAIDRGIEPVKGFMLRQTRADDLNLFVKLSGKAYAKPEDVPMTTVIPAFAISEIRTAFLIGFVIYLPFLAIDFAVASILTALGMVMVSPITFALPLKLIVFVLADGWAMLIGGLVDSFKMSA